MLDKLWETLRGRQKSRAEKLQDRWAVAVAKIADGRPPAEAELDLLLVDAVRTADDLQSAVDRLTKRRQARRNLDRARTIDAERAALESAAEKIEAELDRELEAARIKHDNALAPIREKSRALDDAEKAAVDAEKFLRASHDRPDVVGEIARLGREAGEIRERARRADEEAQRARDHSRGTFQHPGGSQGPILNAVEGEHRVTEFSNAANRLRDEAAAMERQAAALEKELLQP